MSDLLVPAYGGGVGFTKFKDMGDGTYAEVIAMVMIDEAGNALKPGARRMFSVQGATLTRPANTTPYSAGDSISNSATAGSVTAMPVTVSEVNDMPFSINEIEIETDDTGLANGGQIDVYVFDADPTLNGGVGAGDNEPFAQSLTGLRCRFRGTFMRFSDGGKAACRPVDGDNNSFPLTVAYPEAGGKRLWLQYKAVTAFAPSAGGTTLTPLVKGIRAGR